MKALEMGAVETLILWENLDVQRFTLKDKDIEEPQTKFLRPEQEKDKKNFTNPTTGTDLEIVERMPLIEWLANNYKTFGTSLEIITDKSQEGSQFCRGFGGIGGLLRYRVDFQAMDAPDVEELEANIDDYL